jgi:hypothetical protein
MSCSHYWTYTELLDSLGALDQLTAYTSFWDMYPANLQSRCKVSGVQYGTDNVKIISRYDSAILCIWKEGNILRDTTSFKYYKDDGSVTDKHGYFYILLMEDTTFGLS